MLFFITGASGSGKSAIIPHLRQRLPEFEVRDFDDICQVSEYFATAWMTKGQEWRQKATEIWLQRALEYQNTGKNMVICGGTVLGEILACPSAPQINGIEVCLLDCYDVLRIDRVRNRGRGTEEASQDTLSWAGWLRLHAVDPQWRQDVIKNGGASEMEWSRWDSWQRGDPRWRMWRLDTTELTLNEVAELLAGWINEKIS